MSLLLVLAGTFYFVEPGTMKPKEDNKGDQEEEAAFHELGWSQAVRMSLHQFLTIPLAVGEEWLPESSPVEIQLDAAGHEMRIRTRSVLVASILQVLGWILVPLGVGALASVLRRQPR